MEVRVDALGPQPADASVAVPPPNCSPTASLVEIRGGLIPAPGRPSVDPEETIAWEQIAPREIDDEDWRRYEESIAEIFTAFGLEPGTVSTSATPRRFLKALYGFGSSCSSTTWIGSSSSTSMCCVSS